MGGGGKGGTTTQTVSIPPEVLARYNAVNARAETVANTPFKQYSEDPNAFVAPLTPTQQAGIANTNQAAGMAQPYYDTASNMTMAGSQSIGQLTPEQIQKYQNPYTQAVADTTFQNLRQQQAQEMQGATGNAIRSGAFGGDRSGLVAANLARQQQQGTAQAMAPIYQQGYNQAVQTAAGQQGVTAADLARLQQGGQQIAGYGTSAQGAALQGAQAQLGAGQVQQQTAQAGKAALYNQFLQQQGYPFQIAQFLANIAEGTGALSGSTTTTQAPGGFFSDERLKENIKKIGETNDGQPIYKYNYKGDPRTQIGLIAQDVEKSHPDAVGESQGFKTVDYDKATENSEGGAVNPQHAGLGFAGGGSASFDPDMVKEILRRQVEMYQQQGSPAGGKQQVGSASYVPPTPALPSGLSLTKPAAPPPQQPSGLAQAAQTGRNISEGLTMAEGAKTKLFGGTDAKGKPVAGWLDRSDEANKLRAAQEAAEKNAYEEATKGAAHGGLIVGRHHYAGGGMPYGDPEDLSQGYMKSISMDMPSPAQLKGEQDAMRAGKLPDHQASGMSNLASAGKDIYSGGKLASKAYEKAMSMLDKPTPVGELSGAYPAAPAGTPMPPVRPEGLGAATTSAAEVAAPVAETAAATAPAAEAATGLAAAAPLAETAAIAAPAVETAALAAPVAEAAGATAAEAIPMLFSFFSDERLKENIKKIGESTDGQNIYKYNYKGDPRTQIGFLAQEVAHDHPEAVGKKNGYLTVDYDKATSAREHHDGSEGNVVGGSDTPAFDALRALAQKKDQPEAAPAQSSDDFDKKLARMRETTAAIESGNNPRITGKVIPSGPYAGDKAYGLYQVMGKNIPDWTEKALGRRMTPEEYLADTDAQHAVYNKIAGDNLRRYGNVPDAVSVWASGQPISGNKSKDLVSGVPTSSYVDKFMQRMGDGASSYMPQEKGLPSSDVVQSAFKNVKPEAGAPKEKSALGKAGDYFTENRENIIPIIAGLGSMLASNKPNLGQAIGEGIVGGTASYADMMKRGADVKQTEAETKAVQDTNLRNSLTSVNGINGVWLANRTFLPYDEYDNLVRQGKAPSLLGEVPSASSREYQEAVAQTAAKKGEPTGVVPAAPAQPKTSGLLDDTSLKRAAEDRAAINRGTVPAADATRYSEKYISNVQGDNFNATKNHQDILNLAKLVNKAGKETGLGAMGVGYGARTGLLGAANTVTGMLGQDSVSKAPEYAIEFNKIGTRLADVGSDEKTLGQFQANKSAIANGAMDPDTAANMTANLWVANRMAQDQALHANQWGKVSGGNYQSAQTDFNDKFNAGRLTVEKEALADLIRNHGDVLKQLTSDKMSPAEIDAMFQKKDPRLVNMSRYFVKGQ